MTVVSRAIDPWGAQPQPQPRPKNGDSSRDVKSALILIISMQKLQTRGINVRCLQHQD